MEERELRPERGQPESWQSPVSTWEAAGDAPEDGEQPFERCAAPELFTTALEERLEQALQPLLAEIVNLRRDFEAKVKYDGSKERMIESLHRELQAHQQGLHFHVLQPVFMDLIALYDDMGQIIEWMAAEASPLSEQVMRNLRGFQETIAEDLHRHGVEFFRLEEAVFQPQKQRSARVIPTSDPALDRHIARQVRCGFLYEEKLLRHEMVDIYKYKPMLE